MWETRGKTREGAAVNKTAAQVRNGQGLAPQEEHRSEQANGEIRQSGFLRGVNQDENFGDAVFSDGPLDWETQGKIAVEWLPNNAVFQLVLHLEVTENTDPIWIGSS